MQTKLIMLVTLASIGLSHTVANAQGTAFTYQGSLTDGGSPANGNYDFQFRLFAVPSGGLFLGTFSTNNVAVSNGLFTVTLDFDPNFSTGADRWLEIGVRTNGALSFIDISPRQPITSTPYAIRALTAGAVPAGAITSAMLTNGAVTAAKLAPGAVAYLGAPDGSPTNAVTVNAAGLVGIGTTNPLAGLDISAVDRISSPLPLFQVQDETSGYTNLLGVNSIAVFGTLLALSAHGDDAVTVLDVSNPQSPVLLSQFRDGQGSFTNLDVAVDVAMGTNLLAVASSYENTVTLVSLTNPANPVRLAALRDNTGGWNQLGGPAAVAISGNLMAIAAQLDNAVTLVDISDPVAPIKRAEMKEGISGFTNLLGASSVAISENLLAIGAISDDAVTLVDISDPANPVKQAELKDGVGGYNSLNEVVSVALSERFLAIAARLDDTVTLVSVTNPASPVKLAELRNGVGGIDSLDGPRSVAFVSGGRRLAVAAPGSDAVTVFDISNPSNPRRIAVIRDNVAGFNYLDGVRAVAFAGPNLAMAAEFDNALTLASFPLASVGLVSQGWVGIGTDIPAASLHVVGDVVVQSSEFVDLNANRVELGIGTIATGSGSTAMGNATVASGNYSTAIGRNATARGESSVAMGASDAAGTNSTAMGSSTATGSHSTSMGDGTLASGDYSTAIGRDTIASADSSVAMGFLSEASGPNSTAMGTATTASGESATAMGSSTEASGNYSTAMGRNPTARGESSVAMGAGFATGLNSTAMGAGTASGSYSIAMGGLGFASGDYSAAMGRFAWATNQGAFVWSDAAGSTATSTNNNSVTMRATGGYRLFSGILAGVSLAPNGTSWGTLSDREAKKNFQPLKGNEILEKLAAIPIQRWNYQWESDQDVPHIGPVAQDFKAAFYPGRDDKTITTLEFDGVALAAIQGLNQKLEERLKQKDAELQSLKQRLAHLERVIATFTANNH